MAIEGSLQDVGLADLCQLLSMGRKTGCLALTDRSNFGYVFFEDGRIIYAYVLNRPDRLGELLVRNGAITRAQLSEAMEAQTQERGVRLGQILIRQGALSDEVLGRYVSKQIEEAVYYLFTWTSGSFHFDPEQKPEEDGVFLVNLSAESLLLEGARRVDEWSLIEKKITGFDLVFAFVKEPGQEEELTEHQRKILTLVDGERTLDDIVTESGLVEFDVGKAVFGLLQAGIVDQAGRRAAVDHQGDERVRQHLALGAAFFRSGLLEDAVRELQGALDLDPGNAHALFRLGLVALREGRFGDALDLFRRMPEEARSSYPALRNQALALEMLAQHDEALAALADAEKLRPADPDLALARGIVQLKRGAINEALEALRAYRTAPELNVPSVLYYAYTVLASGIAGRLQYAVAVGREGLSRYPESGPLLVNTGAVLELKGDREAAAALYSRAASTAPPLAQAHKNLGDQAHARGDTETARVYYERAVKLNPRLGDDVYYRLGALAEKDGDVDVARLLWRRALDLNPANDRVKSSLESLEARA